MKKISPILFSIFSIYIVVFFWHEISLPYDNSNKIVGNYSENNHHQFNDTLRFICFLILPLLIFITTYFLLNKEKIILKKKVHEENQEIDCESDAEFEDAEGYPQETNNKFTTYHHFKVL